jgi:hypothetical protein
MKIQLKLFLVPFFILFLLIFNTTFVSAQYECPPGMEWSRQTVACEQTVCPPEAGRTYTLECKCPEGTTAEYEELTDPSTGNPYNLVQACVLPSENVPIDENTDGLSEDTPSLQASNSLDTIVHFLPEHLREPFRELAILYREEIPSSPTGRQDSDDNPWLYLFSPGSVNNIFGENEYACGAYQGDVLDWLEKIKNSADPQTRQLLDGFEFGPIQIAEGGHQAVVLFPTGTDWRLTGIVLDPWKEQRPEIYALRGVGDQKDWCEMFWLGLGCPPEGSVGNIIVSIDANTGRYPTTPNPDGSWRYPGDTGRQPATSSTASARKHISVGSPVQVLLSDSYGRRAGLSPSGEFINDFGATIEAHMLMAPDGTYETSFSLPDGQYILEFMGTGSGDVHVLTRHDNSAMEQFQPVFVDPGDFLMLDWQESAPVLKDQQGNTVEYSVVQNGGGDASRLILVIIGALALACFAAMTFVLVLGIFIFKRKKAKPVS